MSEFTKDDDVDDSNSLSDVEESKEGNVQLGFLEKTHNHLFRDRDYNNWDGGKVGGFPIWLNPLTIPSTTELQCSSCGEPMTFLMQIYCPLDDVPDAFHRCLYWFCCKKKDCFDETIKCFRNQLPEVNPYYSNTADGVESYPHLCGLCGCRATSCCSKCKSIYYCSRSHQKEHWKQHKSHCTESNGNKSSLPTSPVDQAQLNYTFPEYEIVIEEEDVEDIVGKELLKNAKVMETTTIWDGAEMPGGDGEDADATLTQTDYNNALGSEKHDPVYINFLTRIQQGGSNQVLRYNRWSQKHSNNNTNNGEIHYNGPLLVSSENNRINPIPHCERCGAVRAFECQIMPQLLHYLQVDKQTKIVSDFTSTTVEPDGIVDTTVPTVQSGSFQNKTQHDFDFGSIDVYTCTKSCSTAKGDTGSGYCTEYIVVQPPPPVYRVKRHTSICSTVSGGTVDLMTPVQEETSESSSQMSSVKEKESDK